MTPHAASPAPIAQTRVFKVVIAVVKKLIKFKTKIADLIYFVYFYFSDETQKKIKPYFVYQYDLL